MAESWFPEDFQGNVSGRNFGNVALIAAGNKVFNGHLKIDSKNELFLINGEQVPFKNVRGMLRSEN